MKSKLSAGILTILMLFGATSASALTVSTDINAETGVTADGAVDASASTSVSGELNNEQRAEDEQTDASKGGATISVNPIVVTRADVEAETGTSARISAAAVQTEADLSAFVTDEMKADGAAVSTNLSAEADAATGLAASTQAELISDIRAVLEAASQASVISAEAQAAARANAYVQ